MFSKSAVGHATASLAHELLPLGIRVNGIAPGLFVTEMSAPGTMDTTGISHLPPGVKFRGQTPVSRPVAPGQQRAGTNLDMGTLALFLVANWFVDGETILIDGGVSPAVVPSYAARQLIELMTVTPYASVFILNIGCGRFYGNVHVQQYIMVYGLEYLSVSFSIKFPLFVTKWSWTVRGHSLTSNPCANAKSNLCMITLTTTSISNRATGRPTQFAGPKENGMKALRSSLTSSTFDGAAGLACRSHRSGVNESGLGEKYAGS